MKRSCQRHTQVFDLPVRRMISLVPTPSALNRTISARQTCLFGVLRSRASAFRRRRSAGLRVMEIPVRMRQTRMHPVSWESPPGFKCQTRSTSDGCVIYRRPLWQPWQPKGQGYRFPFAHGPFSRHQERQEAIRQADGSCLQIPQGANRAQIRRRLCVRQSIGREMEAARSGATYVRRLRGGQDRAADNLSRTAGYVCEPPGDGWRSHPDGVEATRSRRRAYYRKALRPFAARSSAKGGRRELAGFQRPRPAVQVVATPKAEVERQENGIKGHARPSSANEIPSRRPAQRLTTQMH